MELTLENLQLSSATQPIPDYGKGSDPYQALVSSNTRSIQKLMHPCLTPFIRSKSTTTYASPSSANPPK